MSDSLVGSFTAEFFGDVNNDTRKPGKKPTNVADALREVEEEDWETMSREVFNLPGDRVDLKMVLDKIIETDTVDGLEVPVGVYIDPDGYFIVQVYDDEDVTRECAWCGRTTKLGDGRVSSGMCKECEKKDIEKGNEDNPKRDLVVSDRSRIRAIIRDGKSGYVQCACRDCFDIAVGTMDSRGRSHDLCNDCEKAGCSADGDEDCKREETYGIEDVPGILDKMTNSQIIRLLRKNQKTRNPRHVGHVQMLQPERRLIPQEKVIALALNEMASEGRTLRELDLAEAISFLHKTGKYEFGEVVIQEK